MRLITTLMCAAILIISCWTSIEALGPTQKFDEWGDINCESEMAHLDNLAVQLQQSPDARAVMIFYGGRMFQGKLPRRGEAAARAARLKPYLVSRRGIPADHVQMIDGGYRDEFVIEVFVVPAGASMPTATSTVSAKEIKFRKGQVNARTFRCQI